MTGRRNARGLALIDFLLLLIAAVLAFQLFVKLMDYREFRYRYACFDQQKAIDEATWEYQAESGKEVPQLNAGYVIRFPSGRRVLHLIYLPGPEERAPTDIALDFDDRHIVGTGLCPLHQDVIEAPVIDYWYGAGRWWCLNNALHN